MRYGHFDDESPRVRHHDAAHALPLDQLPGVPGVLLADLPHGRRLLASTATPRCADSRGTATTTSPFDDGGRYFFDQRRRRRVDARRAAGQGGPRLLRDAPRDGLHADHGRARRACGVESLLFVPVDDQRRDPPGHRDQHVGRRQVAHAVLASSSSPCGTRRTTRPTTSATSRSARSRSSSTARRVGDLPPHRVPGASQPLRRLRRQRARSGLRHRPGHVRRALQRPRRGGRAARRGPRPGRWPRAGTRSAR